MPTEEYGPHDAVVGDRREALISRYADRLALAEGMSADEARRYTEHLYAAADPLVLVSRGQVWRIHRPDPHSLRETLGVGPGEELTVAQDELVAGYLVVCEGGLEVNVSTYLPRYHLAEWPAQFRPEDPPPSPPAPMEPPESETDVDAEPPWDPRQACVLVSRQDVRWGTPGGEYRPILAPCYTVQEGKHRTTGVINHFTFADIPALIALHLEDYRSGWAPWRADYTPGPQGPIDYFNELGDGPRETDLDVAAYMGWWLWRRYCTDAVATLGGKLDDWQVSSMWAPTHADKVLELYRYADPRVELPPDHPLAQCEGQGTLS
jgi:hypothetical protein